MRLLQSSSLELKDFSANQIPPYAILSHTWGEDEVLFTDFQENSAEGKAGYQKTLQSCKRAATDDKRSSAELSEAINSMFNWYERAGVCYGYLADVSTDDACENPDSEFARSRLFKRGWTLQELIAPVNVIFLSREWSEIGTKPSLCVSLAKITCIDIYVLDYQVNFETMSVAHRMSWASHRETTRKEDIAYCLMGLFGVNMPLLYGEEDNAFIRLQEEIIRHSDDESLFAWTNPQATATEICGMLAKAPASFAGAAAIRPVLDSPPASPFSISNQGLRIELRLTQTTEQDVCLAALRCTSPSSQGNFLSIFLKRMGSGSNQYARYHECPKLYMYAKTYQLFNSSNTRCFFQVGRTPNEGYGHWDYKLVKGYASPRSSAPPTITGKVVRAANIEFTKGKNRLSGAILFEHVDSYKFAVLLGTISSTSVGFDVCLVPNGLDDLTKAFSNFSPKPAGTDMILKNRWLHVRANIRNLPGVHIYFLEISVKAISYEPNPPGMVSNEAKNSALTGLQGGEYSAERRLNNEVGPSLGLRKLKMHFRSLRP